MAKKKSRQLQLLEYIGFRIAVAVARALPFGALRVISSLLGRIVYTAIPKRRNIALDNLRNAFGDRLTQGEIVKLARRSCTSFFLTAVEIIRSPFRFDNGRIVRDPRYKTAHLEQIFEKAKKIHGEAGGCIFVTPHLGNWELLPYVSSLIGIPLAIVMRPLDNDYLERAILSNRIASGQVIIPKNNALFTLERLLKHGKSIGVLPDQATNKGLRVDFFGREATVTPIPALLAIYRKRPVVVVAACRTEDPYYFEGFVSDPILPEHGLNEREQIIRMTLKINLEMEKVIRKYPEQYLWMHNRWKTSHRTPVFG